MHLAHFFMQILILLFQSVIELLFLPMAGSNIKPAQNSVLKIKKKEVKNHEQKIVCSDPDRRIAAVPCADECFCVE